MKKFSFQIALVILIVFSKNAISQDVYGIWTGVEVTKPLTNSLSVSIAPELRMANSPFRVDDMILEASVVFKPLSWLQLVGGYRYSRFYESDFDDRFNGHRYSFAVRPRIELGRFTFTYRGQYQHSMFYWYDYGYSIESKDVIRNRLQVSCNIPNTKIEPFVMGEINYRITSGKQHEFYRLRIRAGVSYPLKKRNEIEVFGQYQQKLNTNNPETSYAMGLFYNFSFKKYKPAERRESLME